MSLLSRAPLRAHRAVGPQLAAPIRFVHGHYHHLPFKWPGEKKAIFGMKVFAFLASGFSIPFLASAYQLKKAGG